MAAGWNAEMTKALIAIWSQENVQSQLDNVVRNRYVYENVAKQLAEAGYERTWQQ